MTKNDPSYREACELPWVYSPILIWGGVALIVAIIFCTANNSAMVLGVGFFAKRLGILVGALFGWVGAMIGDALRKIAQPDTVFKSGSFQQFIWLKLFWTVGPQSIGVVLGVALGCVLVMC